MSTYGICLLLFRQLFWADLTWFITDDECTCQVAEICIAARRSLLPSAGTLTNAMRNDWQTLKVRFAPKSQNHIFSSLTPTAVVCRLLCQAPLVPPIHHSVDERNFICGSQIFWKIRESFPLKMLRFRGQSADPAPKTFPYSPLSKENSRYIRIYAGLRRKFAF